MPILVGSDGMPGADTIGEAIYLVEIGALSPKEAFCALAETTPRSIFPERKIGALRPGYEASFVTLGKDPTADIRAVEAIGLRVMQGQVIEPPPVADR